jgi:hypothetical protein
VSAGAVDERRRVLDFGGLARSEGRGHRRRGLRLGRVDADARPELLDGARDPADQATGAVGDDHRVDVREVIDQLEADRPVPGHHALVLDRVHEEALDALVPRLLDRPPPVLVGDREHAAA